MTLAIAKQVSAYVKDYQSRHGIGRKEMAALVGMSLTSIGRIEENSEGIALKNLEPIAKLEYASLGQFITALEGDPKKAKAAAKETDNKKLERLIHTADKGEFDEFMRRADELDSEKAIGHRFAWSIRLINLILRGTGTQLIEMETAILNYYLNNIEEGDKRARTRITSLLRYRFKV